MKEGIEKGIISEYWIDSLPEDSLLISSLRQAIFEELRDSHGERSAKIQATKILGYLHHPFIKMAVKQPGNKRADLVYYLDKDAVEHILEINPDKRDSIKYSNPCRTKEQLKIVQRVLVKFKTQE